MQKYTQKSKFISLLVGVILILVLLIVQATKESSTKIYQPSELASSQTAIARIRVGGRVANKPIDYQLEPVVLQFSIHDAYGENQDIPKSIPTVQVRYENLKPDMFAVGRDVIIDGEYKDGVVHAAQLLTQCPSKYEPPTPE